MVTDTGYNPRTCKGGLWVRGQPWLHSETLSQNEGKRWTGYCDRETSPHIWTGFTISIELSSYHHNQPQDILITQTNKPSHPLKYHALVFLPPSLQPQVTTDLRLSLQIFLSCAYVSGVCHSMCGLLWLTFLHFLSVLQWIRFTVHQNHIL